MSGVQGIGRYHSVESFIQASPRWVVKSEATDEIWNSAIMSYSALNVKIYRWPPATFLMADRFHAMELDAKYGMSVEVAVPIRKVCYYLPRRTRYGV
jgi:hypothetical protein